MKPTRAQATAAWQAAHPKRPRAYERKYFLAHRAEINRRRASNRAARRNLLKLALAALDTGT